MHNNHMTIHARCVFLMFLVLCARNVNGTPVIGTTETWDSGTFADSGWTHQPGTPFSGGAQTVDTGSIGSETAVRIMFGDQGFGPYEFEDEKIYATETAQGGNFLGDFSAQNISVNFRFYADDYTTPDSTLALFFYSSTGNRLWTYSLDGPATIDAWYDYDVGMAWAGGWTSPGAGQTEFMADLADVDQLGIWVFRTADLPAQTYGLDDFGFSLLVPEPSTYALLAFTLLTLALTLRRRQLLPAAGMRMPR